MKQETLPEIETTPEFKERVEHNCQEFNLNYETVVTSLLEEWMNGNIPLSIEPDPEFVASAREAFASGKTKQTLKKLGRRYDPTRTYPNAVKA